jgi:putative oxidoreductase
VEERTGQTRRPSGGFTQHEALSRGAEERYQKLGGHAIVLLLALHQAPRFCCNLVTLSGGSMRYLERLQPLALLFVRIVLGSIMVVHGAHKVFGGLHHHADFVASLGLPAWTGYVSSFTEFLGGLFVLAGFFTRAAAFAICVDLIVAIWKVHLHNGLTGDHGFEFPLAAATLAFALIFFGAGPIAIDHVLRGGGSIDRGR